MEGEVGYERVGSFRGSVVIMTGLNPEITNNDLRLYGQGKRREKKTHDIFLVIDRFLQYLIIRKTYDNAMQFVNDLFMQE